MYIRNYRIIFGWFDLTKYIINHTCIDDDVKLIISDTRDK
jgi:hypothetical protein